MSAASLRVNPRILYSTNRELSKMDKSQLRRTLIARRQNLDDAQGRIAALGAALWTWLGQFSAQDDAAPQVIAAYWPIKGEFDPLPTLVRWRREATQQRRIALPVVDAASKTMRFHDWPQGCTMRPDAYGIPTPVGTPQLRPDLLLVPCVGYAPAADGRGWRLGYGGGFYDRTLAALQPKPRTLGLAFACAAIDGFVPEPHDAPLDQVLNENGLIA